MIDKAQKLCYIPMEIVEQSDREKDWRRMGKVNQTTMVYEKLKARIEAGDYSPAESLTEIDLANEYGVSRNTIKKALLMLENDAYVTIEPNKGAKVRSYSKSEVLDFLELRVELEGFIIRLAVPAFTKDDIGKLDAIFAAMVRCQEENDLIGYSAHNREFHDVIYQACPNKTATELLIRLKGQMRKYDAKTILVPGRGGLSCEEHRRILDAVKARDVQTAESVTREHIANVRKTYEEYYSLLF